MAPLLLVAKNNSAIKLTRHFYCSIVFVVCGVFMRSYYASACRFCPKYATLIHRAEGLAENLRDRYFVKVELS